MEVGEIKHVELNREEVTDLIRAGLKAKHPKAHLNAITYKMFQNRWSDKGPIFSAILTLEKIE